VHIDMDVIDLHVITEIDINISSHMYGFSFFQVNDLYDERV
jgi:hypothetical protein